LAIGSVLAISCTILGCGGEAVEEGERLEPIGAARPSALLERKGTAGRSRAHGDASVPVDAASGGTRDGEGLDEDAKISSAIELISKSEHTFLAPQDEEPPTEYSGAEFARMLERKWKWIGPDLHGFDVWMREIGERSFRHDLPYQVRLTDGTEQEFGPWLREQMG
jgi:hypothetical protein